MRLITLIALLMVFRHAAMAIAQTSPDEERIAKATALIENVADRFHINYEMSRLHKIGYYKESVADSSTLYYIAEGIVEIYTPPNLNQKDNAFVYPIKTRKKASVEIAKEKLLFGNASDMARSSIWRPNSFLAEKKRRNLTFTYLGKIVEKGNKLHVISFEPKKAAVGLASGTLYIDTSYLGITKIVYHPVVQKSHVWLEVSWTENFEFINGAYELTSVYFQGISRGDTLHYEASLVMNQLETVSSIPEYLVFVEEDVPLFEKASENFTEDFWLGFEYLKKKAGDGHLVVAEIN